VVLRGKMMRWRMCNQGAAWAFFLFFLFSFFPNLQVSDLGISGSLGECSIGEFFSFLHQRFSRFSRFPLH